MIRKIGLVWKESGGDPLVGQVFMRGAGFVGGAGWGNSHLREFNRLEGLFLSEREKDLFGERAFIRVGGAGGPDCTVRSLQFSLPIAA